MKAVILAAGKGTRMLPLTLEKPKPLLEVLGKPLISHLIDILPDEVEQLVIVVGYMGDMIRAYLGTTWRGQPIIYEEQKVQNGIAPALHLAKRHLHARERFLFFFADDIYDAESLQCLLKHPRAMLVAPVEHPERFGIVTADTRGKLLEMVEKPERPQSNLASTGAYLFDTHFFEYEPEPHQNGEYYLPPIIRKMAREHDVYVESASLWIPVGYPEDLKEAETILADRAVGVE